jgi:hypothetical protein
MLDEAAKPSHSMALGRHPRTGDVLAGTCARSSVGSARAARA